MQPAIYTVAHLHSIYRRRRLKDLAKKYQKSTYSLLQERRQCMKCNDF